MLIIWSGNGKTGFSDWISKETGRAIGRACRGSEVPLRAFCRKVRDRLHGNLAESGIKSIGVPEKAAAFCGDLFNCDALACVVKLIYPSKQYV